MSALPDLIFCPPFSVTISELEQRRPLPSSDVQPIRKSDGNRLAFRVERGRTVSHSNALQEPQLHTQDQLWQPGRPAGVSPDKDNFDAPNGASSLRRASQYRLGLRSAVGRLSIRCQLLSDNRRMREYHPSARATGNAPESHPHATPKPSASHLQANRKPPPGRATFLSVNWLASN